MHIVCCLVFCSCANTINTDIELKQLDATLKAILEETYVDSYEGLAGISLAVSSPLLKEPWTGAHGFDSTKKDSILSTNQPYRIASVTKTFVAVAILRLHEIDSLSIDDPIGKYISNEHIQILKSGGYSTDSILIKHCLNHTSGLNDYAMAGDDYIKAIIENPSKRWTRTQQIKGAMVWGDRVGNPGEKYSYCDTGYILLGEIAGIFFDDSLATALRSLLKFDKLQMNNTWLESLEENPNPNAKPVHRYARGYETTEWDPSIDLYGGGGLMSTSKDLAIFMHALFNDKIFENKNTIELMLTKPQYHHSYDSEENERHKDYRYGLWQNKIYGDEIFLHRGLWGTALIYIPAYNCTIASNVTKGSNDRFLKKVILTMKNLSQKS